MIASGTAAGGPLKKKQERLTEINATLRRAQAEVDKTPQQRADERRARNAGRESRKGRR